LFSDNRGGPWGPGDGDDEGGGGGEGPRNPWGPRRRKTPSGGGPGSGGPGPFDELLKKGRERFGGGFPRDGRPYWLYGLVAFLLLWVMFTSTWRIGAQEIGVVTTFGRYSGTIGPGVGFSLPAPFGSVTKIDVLGTRVIPIPSSGENLVLTGDQNVVDLAYSVRWNIKNPELYAFQIADPEATIRDAAESAMRAAVARVTLDDAIGAGRADIALRVQQSMQQVLDQYGSGVQVLGVAINQSGPPERVNDAFLEVSAAQQRAQSSINNARSYALQTIAAAQGEAAAFDRVYTQYRAAPVVTRRRMYYETMERVLQHVDTTIVEAPGVTPYLALPDVQRRAQAPAQPQGAPAQ
jgi:membrane protease subunit HflK